MLCVCVINVTRFIRRKNQLFLKMKLLQFFLNLRKNVNVTFLNIFYMLCMAIKNVEFRFNNTIYRQVDGVAMGSPMGPILVNTFVGYFESICLHI